MKPIVTRLYAVLVALTFVGLAAWSAADWYQLKQKAQDLGRTQLRQAAGLVSDLTLRPGLLEPAGLERIFAQVPGTDSHWKMVLLISPEHGTEYYRGPRPAQPVDQAVPRWEPQPLTEVMVSIPVFQAVGESLTLQGIYQFYGRLENYQLLKACGITLVVLLVLTTIVVLLSSRAKEYPEESQPDAFDEDAVGPAVSEDLEEPIRNQETLPVSAENEDEYWFDDTLTLDDLPPLEGEPSFVTPVPEPEARSGPSLFSPESGLGWESFLDTRLDSELGRASDRNQDLALILFEAKSGRVSASSWGRAIREAFPFADLNFEYQGGAAVVLPGSTLEQGIQSAKAFLELADRSWSGAAVHAGVAARTGRLLSSSTLVGEAVSAKRRSLSGTVRVLGLKTDPDRYRAHLASASA